MLHVCPISFEFGLGAPFDLILPYKSWLTINLLNLKQSRASENPGVILEFLRGASRPKQILNFGYTNSI